MELLTCREGREKTLDQQKYTLNKPDSVKYYAIK